MKISEFLPGAAWLRQADSVAALGVSAIVAYVSIQMGIRTIQGLLDTSPDGMDQRVAEIIESVDGVTNCHKVRVRMSGPSLFADAHIRVNPKMSIQAAYEKTKEIERKIAREIPGMEITIHVEPERKKNDPRS